MFSIITNISENTIVNNNDNDDQTLSLEAFQGDSALIQTVNELNQLKTLELSAI